MGKVGKQQAPAICKTCGADIAVPGRGIYNIVCDSCGEWNTNKKTQKPKVDMTMYKADLLKIATDLNLDVSDKDTKSEIIEAIEAAT